jgi:hypothetical protein
MFKARFSWLAMLREGIEGIIHFLEDSFVIMAPPGEIFLCAIFFHQIFFSGAFRRF